MSEFNLRLDGTLLRGRRSRLHRLRQRRRLQRRSLSRHPRVAGSDVPANTTSDRDTDTPPDRDTKSGPVARPHRNSQVVETRIRKWIDIGLRHAARCGGACASLARAGDGMARRDTKAAAPRLISRRRVSVSCSARLRESRCGSRRSARPSVAIRRSASECQRVGSARASRIGSLRRGYREQSGTP